MKSNSIVCKIWLLFFFFFISSEELGVLAQSRLTCRNRYSPCYRRQIACPKQCPDAKPSNPKAKACFLDCNSPKCETTCRGRKPKCNGVGSGCYDPRFIGGDGIVFYFHGKKDEHFSLVSDRHLQINARFIGLRPAGRPRDFTWIQALGLMYGGNHAFTVEATRAARWDAAVDHLSFTFDGEPFELAEGHLAAWRSPDGKVAVERTGSRNSVTVALEGAAEVALNVVPVTAEDDRVHKYGIPSDDCFAHLEVQFRFFELSAEVEGVLDRTYRRDFKNTAKAGVAMPVVGGEDKYSTSSLVSPDCMQCLFSPIADD
ncbi:hypothetical protein Cni_G13590 [Canna indica]|uniref:Uncharacterized protein n=1 Tax=Canna indica TaxID=4628 RepID=A0AAQ3KCW5_9LILI|nr:hypothetical protein Cni_G13590 [Canna indica]